MTYQLQKTKPKKAKFIFLAFLVIIVIIYLFYGSEIKYFFSSETQQKVAPILKSTIKINNSAKDSLPFLKTKTTLIKENNELKEKLGEINSKIITNNLLLEENKRLKALLGRNEVFSFVLATIISRPNKTPYGTMIIDIGSNANIKQESKVFVFGQILIGTVEQVYENTSKIVMFSSPGRKTDVLIGKSNISVKITGKGGGNFEVDLPKDTEIKKGDLVTLAGINLEILGIVENMEISSGGSFKKILIISPVNINELRWVEILTNKTSPEEGTFPDDKSEDNIKSDDTQNDQVNEVKEDL